MSTERSVVWRPPYQKRLCAQLAETFSQPYRGLSTVFFVLRVTAYARNGHELGQRVDHCIYAWSDVSAYSRNDDETRTAG